MLECPRCGRWYCSRDEACAEIEAELIYNEAQENPTSIEMEDLDEIES